MNVAQNENVIENDHANGNDEQQRESLKDQEVAEEKSAQYNCDVDSLMNENSATDNNHLSNEVNNASEMGESGMEQILDIDKRDDEVKTVIDPALIEDMLNQVELLKSRCDQLNDVKQSIRSLNDQIRDELYIDFSELANLMKFKLEEMADRIKEKLKDAYTVVRDSQNKIATRLGDIRAQLTTMATSSGPNSLGKIQ